jgi:hypothetical protein
VSTKEIGLIINNFFIDKLNQTFKEEIMPILCNLFQNMEAEGVLPNSELP